MADFKISRIRFRWVGDWLPTTGYVKDDVVRYGGKTYVSLKTHTSASNFYTDFEAVDTQVPPQADPYWELMFDGYEWTADWTMSTFYQEGDMVKKNGIVYLCTQWHTSTEDETNFDSDYVYWTIYTSTLAWKSAWQPSTSYSVNDLVKYAGMIYRCTIAHVSAVDFALGLEADMGSWVAVSDTELWRNTWAVDTRYRLNDIVRYNGVVYRCTNDHTSAETIELGLEDDIDSWAIFYENFEYKGTWTPATFRYIRNDIVKYGASLWACLSEHLSSTSFDETKWVLYLPGFEYENVWTDATIYQPGDIVNYGGYNYYSLTHNSNQIPSVESDDWELLTKNYDIRGDWNSTTNYLVGDLVRRGGMLYVAIQDSTNQETTNTTYWELVVPGERWIGGWQVSTEYLIGDIVTYISTSYRCLTKHTSTNLNRPDLDTLNVNWTKLVEGNQTNVLAYLGDIKTYGFNVENSQTESIRREIGAQGNALKVVNSESKWQDFNVINKVYYVSVDGSNSNSGESLEDPWRTIKYACDNITGPATIFIKTGLYEEQLPISIPAEVALVGDELRGTTVQAAVGYEQEDMFYVRNASGIRNMTLKGLNGTLSPINIYGTSRPTAGAYVSLDPGTGPADNNVWITSRSPYVQNVTTFGTACVGLKVDGALHSGGNKSIVANDFTQVLSDGIGAWVTNLGLSELVSVFTYYNYIGYLAENGGKIRGTNGNNSYGTYGSVAEGYDLTEPPITGTVNNRSQEALVGSVITKTGEILKMEFLNNGEEYSSASFSFDGTGLGATAIIDDFRDNAIYQCRIYTPGDSSTPGGSSYVTISNNAQTGDLSTITISAADDNTFSNYFGMRVIITGGTGAGQYGRIYQYDGTSKIMGVLRESDDQPGWDHVVPGTPIETILDTTTVYQIEPLVSFNFPGFDRSSTTLTTTANWVDVTYCQGNFIAIASGSNTTNLSSNGSSWTVGGDLPASATWTSIATGTISAQNYVVSVSSGGNQAAYSTNNGDSWTGSILSSSGTWSSVAYGGSKFIAIRSVSNETSVSSNGTSWLAGGNLPASTTWSSVAYGNSVWVAIASGGTQAAYSTDYGTTWTSSTLPSSGNWSSLVYGNGRFVAIRTGSNQAAYSFDGNTWYGTNMPLSANWTKVKYGQGVFLAIANASPAVAYSTDGVYWKNSGDDSTAFTMPATSTWSSLAFGNPSSTGKWVAITTGPSAVGAVITTGARALGRAHVSSGRISKISLWDPGSGYISSPAVSVYDPNKLSSVYVRLRRGNGVLGNPLFTNKGTGYLTSSTTVTVTGNGYSDNYQLGKFLILKNITLIPGPGDNLTISGINDSIYKIITIEQLGGTLGNFDLKLQISPFINVEESPEHNSSISIRQKYSQVRLTGHDFLDIGVGNFIQSGYPGFSENPKAPENEIIEKGGGRCFYTSTDQDGNFRVGELFKVDQATGTVTISADLFNLSGLSELQLGGVTVGGTGVVVREFSTDSTFTANSNNIIPTQKAIKAYLQASISGGGSNALASILTAGVVRVGPQAISTTTGTQIEVNKKVKIGAKGISGTMLAMTYFMDSFSNDAD